MDLQREYLSKNHAKYLLKYYVILVCKYRCKALNPQEVRRFYWGGHNIFWTKGYFVSSVGNVSQETIQRYIENQG